MLVSVFADSGFIDRVEILRQSHQAQRNLQKQPEGNAQLTLLLEESSKLSLSFQQHLIDKKALHGSNSRAPPCTEKSSMASVEQADVLSRSLQTQSNDVHDYSNDALHEPSNAPRVSVLLSTQRDFERQMDDERQRNTQCNAQRLSAITGYPVRSKSPTIDQPLPRCPSRKALKPTRSVNSRQNAIGNMAAILENPHHHLTMMTNEWTSQDSAPIRNKVLP